MEPNTSGKLIKAIVLVAAAGAVLASAGYLAHKTL